MILQQKKDSTTINSMGPEIIAFTFIGIIAGMLSGLLGIGGGVITIPCLLFSFKMMGLPPNSWMHLAIGTSLAAMIFNTFSAAWSHHKKQSVLFEVVKPMALGILFGGMIGATFARILPSFFLQNIFGAFEVILGIRFLIPTKKPMREAPLPHFWKLSGIALAISSLSTFLGIGGGLINVPILMHYHVPAKKAIGTSAALSFLISAFGAMSFLVMGIQRADFEHALGYIYIPAFWAISITSFVVAPFGAKLAHHLHTHHLRKVFGIALCIAGLAMIFAK